MGPEIDIDAEWHQQWFQRRLPALLGESYLFTFVCMTTSLCLMLRVLLQLRRAGQSKRAADIAESSRHLKKTTRRQWYITQLYLLHALALWLVDAGLGVAAVWNHHSENPEMYTTGLWLELALYSVRLLAIFTAVFVLFPLGQIVFFSCVFAKYRGRGVADNALRQYIPELRTLSTHLAHLWMLLGYLLIAFWPVFLHGNFRIFLAEAIFGSGIAWSHVSFILNFRAERIANIEIRPGVSTKEAVKLYGANAVGSVKLPLQPECEKLLPTHEDGN